MIPMTVLGAAITSWAEDEEEIRKDLKQGQIRRARDRAGGNLEAEDWGNSEIKLWRLHNDCDLHQGHLHVVGLSNFTGTWQSPLSPPTCLCVTFFDNGI